MTTCVPPCGDEGVLSPRYRALTVGLVVLVAIRAFEVLAVSTAMPVVAARLHGMSLYALGFAAPLASGVVGMTVAGQYCDLRGPARVLWHGLAIFLLGVVCAGCAPAMAAFVAARAVQGLGGGAITEALYVVAARAFPETLRPRVFAAFSAGWVLPSMLGPSLSGMMVQYLSWRWVFLVVPVMAVPAAWMVRPALRALPCPHPVPARPDARIGWSLLGAAGVLSLGLAGHAASGVWLLVSIAALALAAMRLLPAGTLRCRRGLPSVIALRAMLAACFLGSEAFVPLLLVRERAWPPALAGVTLSVGALGWAAGAWWQGRHRHAATRLRLLRVGMLGVGLGLGMVPLVLAMPVPAILAVLAWAVAGLGMGLAYPSLSVLLLSLSPAHRHGEHSAALELAEALAISTLLAATGSVFGLLFPAHAVLAFASCFIAPALLIALAWGLSSRVLTAS